MSDTDIKLTKIGFGNTDLYYEASSDTVKWRAKTLFTKEPDTVNWIAQFKEGDVFVDIGANVGMYTVLASKAQKAMVFAFEPESQNYALLNRNIVYNQIQANCIAYCMALTDQQSVDQLYMSEFKLGGSCHTFGENIDYHLKERKHQLTQGCVSTTLDKLIADNVLPQPDHIKIDVDGLEHLVIKGAASALKSPNLKSILIELNTHLEQHQEIIGTLEDIGFIYDQRQVEIAVRQEGSFQGIGNYIFYRPDSGISFDNLVASMNKQKEATRAPASFSIGPSNENKVTPLKYTMKRLADMEIKHDPYHHFYVDRLFPEEYYAEMMEMKPTDSEVVSINSTGRTNGAYDDRFVMHLADGLGNLLSDEKKIFWENHRRWFCSQEVMVTLIQRFHKQLADAGVRNLNVYPEAMFMRDKKGYSIGPHTDSPRRLLTMMCYLPKDEERLHLGTSVYIPEQKGAQCSGNQHHSFDGFSKVQTARYMPNSAFGFLKSTNSFHGVEPMADDYSRDTLVYIVRHNIQEKA
ncbi:FkbM family methyltransferase [Litoribrevibacter euphylliae]|uniref:FkbM family methyltransferase n=1 Tax=Litoribrevibacter euphylliae TaxID=1834034 RepID=A0ABV7HBG7_9GAMM